MARKRRRKKNLFQRLLSLSAAVLVLGGLIGVASMMLARNREPAENDSRTEPEPALSWKPEAPEALSSPVHAEWKSSSEGFYYSALSENEQAVYRTLFDGVRQYHSEVSLSFSVKEEEMLKANAALIMDHPEFFWISSSSTYYMNTSGAVTSLVYQTTGNEEAILNEISDIADEVIAGLPETEYEAYRYLYDYVINETDYDISDAADSQTITSVFLNKRSVCAGYARAFQYLCQKAGLECIYVTGTARPSNGTAAGHAWNMIRINDRYYWCDCTWGDPVFEGYSSGEMNYNYFCVSDREIQKEHDLETEPSGIHADYPSCTDDSLDWYVLQKAYFDGYDEEVMRQYLVARASEGMTRLVMKFPDAETLSAAETDLIENEKLFHFLNESGIFCHSLSYVKFDGISAMWIIIHPD